MERRQRKCCICQPRASVSGIPDLMWRIKNNLLIDLTDILEVEISYSFNISNNKLSIWLQIDADNYGYFCKKIVYYQAISKLKYPFYKKGIPCTLT